ncbi:MAG: sulfatase-like hydrolase/transferase [Firmicutes bacterium]|nr:sulfatase-like hydrolase/transferase [Bacillota bacterium]
MKAIVVLIDTLRRDHLGFYGNKWIQTPNLDRFAARSVVFDNAYVGSYPCMPARRELFTGRYEFPWRGWGPLEDNDADIASILQTADIPSMLITDHFHLWERGSGNYHFAFTGFEFIRGQENDFWITDPDIKIEYPAAKEKLAKHIKQGGFERYARNIAFRKTERDYFAPLVFQTAIDWVERNRNHKDFFLMIDCFDPHEPFDPPFPYNQMYNPGYKGDQVIWPNYGYCDLSPEELNQVRALYAGEVTMTDRWLGFFLDKVEQLGLMEDTMIVICTDHGHMFGEHGLMGKPWSAMADSNLYQEIAHIPLMVYHPKLETPGKRISKLVQIVDVFPTVLEALHIPIPDNIHGKSLLPYVLNSGESTTIREYACYGRYGEAINITDGEWTLFLWPPTEANNPLYWYSPRPPKFHVEKVIGPYENGRYPCEVPRGHSRSALYNVKDDYQQQRNLIDEEPGVVRRLVNGLKDFIASIGAPREQLVRLGISER